MPLLTIVTRHLTSRVEEMATCEASLDMQTDQDFQHLVIEDAEGRGVGWANRQLVAHRDEVRGDYVFILDDDDVLIDDRFVASIREVAGPDLIVVKMAHATIPAGCFKYTGGGRYMVGLPARDIKPGELEPLERKQGWSREKIAATGLYEDQLADKTLIFPPDRYWEGEECPPFSFIATPNPVVRREVWYKAVAHFKAMRGGDWPFFSAVFRLANNVRWLDRIVSKRQTVNMDCEYITDFERDKEWRSKGGMRAP